MKELPDTIANKQYYAEAQVDSEFARRVIPWIQTHKLEFLRKILINTTTLWFIADYWRKSVLLMLFMGPVLAGCIVGIRVARRQGWTALDVQMVAILASLYLFYSAVSAYSRYLHVALPLAFYFCAIAGHAIAERRGWGRAERFSETAQGVTSGGQC
jgi:hypothetical protein